MALATGVVVVSLAAGCGSIPPRSGTGDGGVDGGQGDACTGGRSCGASSSGGTSGGDGGGAASTVKRVFVTSRMFHGNLGGIAGADSLCQQAADGAGLGGTWQAWISDSQVDAAGHVDGVGPWYLVDGHTRVFNASPSIVPLAPITLDEYGHQWTGVSGLYGAWTGTTSDGLRTYYDCGDWTTESFTDGTVGQPENGGEQWGGGDPSIDDVDCGTWNSLICFEE